MTAHVDMSPPGVSRFLLRSLFWALAAHVLVILAMNLPSDTRAGSDGGGKVLGRLSVSLGGSGAAGPSEMEPLVVPEPAAPKPATPEPIIPDTIVPRVEPVVRPIERVRDPAPARVVNAPDPRVEKPRPVRRDPVPAPEPQQGEKGDGKPAGATAESVPTLGEGAAAGAPGLGIDENAAANQRGAYLATVRARVERERFYPSAARRSYAEGVVLLRMEIAADGRLVHVEQLEGSGSFHLDRAAKRMIEKAAPFPPPPAGPFTLSLPVAFALE